VTARPAALVLADHALARVRAGDQAGVRAICLCDHPEHQADMLAEAGLLASVGDDERAESA
jgi:hypothetical protein